MKKLLFTLSMSAPILIPFALVSCGTDSAQDRIAKAKAKIAEIVSSKPKPTLVTPPASIINLETYLKQESFEVPKIETAGVKIEIENIELPTPGLQNLIIWLKVTSTDTLDIAPEISDFYFVNFNEITGVDPNTIQPILASQLKQPFEDLLNSKRGLMNRLVNDALAGVGAFNGQSKIDPITLVADPKPLNDRLTTSVLNSNIFDGHQANVYMVFDKFDKPTNKLFFSVELHAPESENKATFAMQFDYNQLGRSL